MNTLVNLLRAVAFLLITFISAGILGGSAVWVVSTLDPATQEVIGRVSFPPWLSAARHSKLARTEAASVAAAPWRNRARH